MNKTESFNEEAPLLEKKKSENSAKTPNFGWKLFLPLIISILLVIPITVGTILFPNYKNKVYKPTESLKFPIPTPKFSNVTPQDSRLPQTLKPKVYWLTLIPFFPDRDQRKKNEFTFTGIVTIEFESLISTSNVTLHVNGLTIDAISPVRNENGGEIVANATENIPEKHQFVIKLTEFMKKGRNYNITLSFSGKINTDTQTAMFATSYVESGLTNWIVGTQMEGFTRATPYAREVFPCFDEPNYKAKFNVKIEHKKYFTALSNGEVKNTIQMRNNWVKTEFAETPPMSTHLLCFTVGSLVSSATYTKAGTKVSIWTWPSMVNLTSLALYTANSTVQFFGELFDFPYPLPKADFVALPSFSSSGTEFWGLILFPYKTLLFDPEIQNTEQKISVISTISHEVAHQWLGDLVTMDWWDDIFLAEGLTKYYEFSGIGNAFPAQKDYIDDSFLPLVTLGALTADSAPSTHPVHDINGPDFGPLTYDKGAALLRMVSSVIGETALNDGIKDYLEQFAYGNANYQQLFEVVSKHVPKNLTGWNRKNLNLSELMHFWMTQAGHPKLMVYKNDNESTVRQLESEKFWPAPIWYGNENRKQFAWITNFDEIRVSNDTYVFNLDGQSFVTVEYENEIFESIVSAIKQNPELFSSATKASLLGNIVYKGISDLDVHKFLEFSSTLSTERSASVWTEAIPTFEHLIDMLQENPNFPYLKTYLTQLTEPHMVKNQEKDESWNQLMLTRKLLLLMDRIDGPKGIRESFFNFSNIDVFPDYRDSFYCNSVQNKPETFEKLWTQMTAEQNAFFDSEKRRFQYGLACSFSRKNLLRLLQYAVENRHSSILEWVSKNRIGSKTMLEYLKKPKNRNKLEKNLMLQNFVNAMTSSWNTQEKLDTLQNLPPANLNETLLPIMRRVQSNILWMATRGKPAIQWLQNRT